MLKLAIHSFGWTPSEFWRATVYEFETLLLARLQEVEKPAWTEEQTRAFFDGLGVQNA